ncbi:MAG: trigger factor [Pyrinomonadaceae bacterium]
MKSELVDVSPTRKELKIEIEAEAVRAVYDRITDQYAKLANVPGFRRGRAPRSVVRTRFKEEIRSEVLRELVPQAIQDALNEYSLNVIGEPDVHLNNAERLDQLGEEPISLHAHVEVLPEVTLGEYKGLEAVRRVRPIGDEDVDRVIDNLLETSAVLQPVEDRPAQLGDTVTVDFNGKFVEEPEEEEINVEEVDVVLGGENVQQEFTDNLTGVVADDERKFTVNYPEDFTSKGLAGKVIDYTAKVTAVRKKELPEADDEWAKSLGEDIDSLATLREKIREDLMDHARVESENRMRQQVIEKLVDAHPFEVPESLTERQADQLLQSVARDLAMRGIDPRQQDVEWWKGVREQLKPQAERDVRGFMLLESIAEEENLSVTDEEIEAEIRAMAAASRQAPEQVRAALTKQGGERSIASRLGNRKALDLIVENARVSDEEWREEEPLETGAQEDQEEGASEAQANEMTGEQEDAQQAKSASPEEA